MVRDKVYIEKLNDVYLRVSADPGIKMEISEEFTFKVPGYKFMPSYRNKMWDGTIKLFNAFNGTLYTGLFHKLLEVCRKRDYEVSFCDFFGSQNQNDTSSDIGYDLAKKYQTKFEVRDYQNDAVQYAIQNERGLLVSPTASGKSFIIYLLARYYMDLGKRILIVVPTTSLVDQMISDFEEYNNGNSLDTYKIRGGIDKNTDASLVCSTWQSIYKLDKSWYDQFDVVIGDECHEFKAKSLISIMEKLVDCRYRFGFTGTLDGSKTNELVLIGLFGSTLQVTKTKDLIKNKTLSDFRIKAIGLQYSDEVRKQNTKLSYSDEIDFIVRYEPRNRFIANLAKSLSGNSLILFTYVEKHGKILLPMIVDKCKEEKDIHFIYGGIGTDERESIRKQVMKSDNNIIVASFGTYARGINIPNLHNIVFASPYKSKVKNLQSIGRGLRKAEGKDMATLYDIVDDMSYKKKQNFALRHFLERVNIYNDEGFDYSIYNYKI